MANFPNSPTLNQIYTDPTTGFSFRWDGTVWSSYSPGSLISGVGIATAGGVVGTGVTLFDFRGPGISTVTVSSGIGTINITGRLTIGTRTTSETINLIGSGIQIPLRTGIGTLNF